MFYGLFLSYLVLCWFRKEGGEREARGEEGRVEGGSLSREESARRARLERYQR